MRKVHPISGYMMSLTVLFLILVVPSLFWLLIVALDHEQVADYGTPAWYIFIGLLVICFLMIGIVYFKHRFEYVGIWKAKANGIFVTSLLGIGFTINYEDMKYIGIEYGIINGAKQFWIYISNHPIESKYLHHINYMPIRRDCLRIQYSKAVFNELLGVLPPILKKQLERSYSVIRLHKEED